MHLCRRLGPPRSPRHHWDYRSRQLRQGFQQWSLFGFLRQLIGWDDHLLQDLHFRRRRPQVHVFLRVRRPHQPHSHRRPQVHVPVLRLPHHRIPVRHRQPPLRLHLHLRPRRQLRNPERHHRFLLCNVQIFHQGYLHHWAVGIKCTLPIIG